MPDRDSLYQAVNHDLAMRGRAGPLLYPVASLLITLSTGQLARGGVWIAALVLAIVATSIWRIVLIRRVGGRGRSAALAEHGSASRASPAGSAGACSRPRWSTRA